VSEDIVKRLQACAIAGCSPPERALALEAAAEIARLREERLTDEEVGAICWARAGLLADSDETKARGLRERSEHSREAAETLTRLLERQPLPPGPEGDG